MNQRLLILPLLGLAWAQLQAQQPITTPPSPPAALPLMPLLGRVLSAGDGTPISGATIRVVGVDSSYPGQPGAITRPDGTFTLQRPTAVAIALEIRSIGYETKTITVADTTAAITTALAETETLQPTVQVTGIRRQRSVEDACCRVESLQEEVQQHAPFSPSVGEVLRRYSSCTSARISCSIDNSSSLRLRGLEPTYVKTLIDGMPAFSGLSTFYGLSLIPAGALQTIKISEGASSGLYGNGAVSGVVDLLLRQPTEIRELNVTANLAGDGTSVPEGRDVGVAFTGMAGDVGIAAFGAFNQHEGAAGEETVARDYTRFSGVARANVMADNATELTLTAIGAGESRQGIVAGIAGQDPFRETVDLARYDLMLRGARSFTETSELSIAAMLGTMNATHDAGQLAASRLQQRVAFANLLFRTEWLGNRLTLGGEFRADKMESEERPDLAYDYSIGSIILQDEIHLSEQVGLLGSLRLEKHSLAGEIVVPRGSVRYQPMANMTMRLMAGQGFKGQALFDEHHRSMDGVYRWRNNTGFDFERSTTLNYDISYSFMLGETAGMDANFNAYWTAIDGKGIPDADSLAAGTLFMVNSQRPTRLTGMELQLRPTLGEHWSGSVGLALIRYAMQDASGEYQQLPLAPRANLDASVMYEASEQGIVAEAWGSWIGSQVLPANPSNLSTSPAYTLLNVRIEKAFGKLAAYAGAMNLLDQQQERTMPLAFETSNRAVDGSIVWGPLEGREFFAGIRWTLGGGD
ncbi:MAG: TonB-dependent receptor [Chlorobi bacterium]|nr:TonB-dependent receptor [Chlorobiota bacterium]